MFRQGVPEGVPEGMPRGTSLLKGANPPGTPGYRNGTESFFGVKGHLSVVRDV
jgi:hypothetical protein